MEKKKKVFVNLLVLDLKARLMQSLYLQRQQQLFAKIMLPEYPQEMRELLGSVDNCCGVCGAGETVRNVNAKTCERDPVITRGGRPQRCRQPTQ